MSVIYLDVDGVLCDFFGGVAQVFGMTSAELEAKVQPGEWHLAAPLGIDEDDFWNEIDCRGSLFWSALGLLPNAVRIVEICKAAAPTVLMTSPPRNPAASAGKVEWIRYRLPEFAWKFSITPAKDHFAHAGAVLVDDSDEGVEKFRKAGGHAILLPTYRNSRHKLADRQLDILEHELDLFGWGWAARSN